jgi:transcriptional regulator with XRE-family HTH domain
MNNCTPSYQTELTFGELIKSRRQSLNLTQEELGKQIGVGRGMVIRYESDRVRPSFDVYNKLIQTLNITELIKRGDQIKKDQSNPP